MAEETNQGATAPKAMADGGPANQTGINPATPSASQSMPQYGGLRGGKARPDGLVPGSPEAIQAARDKAAARKARWRARHAAKNPPVLPMATATAPMPSGVGQPPAGNVQAPGVNMAPVPGPARIPWDADLLRPLFEQLIPAAEQTAVASLTRKAAAAKLPVDLLKTIEQDARWSEMSKTGLLQGLPAVTAKMLNRVGISSESAPEVIAVTAIASIAFSYSRLSSKLDEIIASQEAENAK